MDTTVISLSPPPRWWSPFSALNTGTRPLRLFLMLYWDWRKKIIQLLHLLSFITFNCYVSEIFLLKFSFFLFASGIFTKIDFFCSYWCSGRGIDFNRRHWNSELLGGFGMRNRAQKILIFFPLWRRTYVSCFLNDFLLQGEERRNSKDYNTIPLWHSCKILALVDILYSCITLWYQCMADRMLVDILHLFVQW